MPTRRRAAQTQCSGSKTAGRGVVALQGANWVHLTRRWDVHCARAVQLPTRNHATQVSGRLTVLVGGVSPAQVMQERGQHDVSDPENHCHDDYVGNRKIEGTRQDEARQQSFGDLIQTRSTPT